MGRYFILLFIIVVIVYFLFLHRNEMQYFYYEDIPENIKLKMIGNSYHENEFVSFNDLVYVHVLYIGFDNLVHRGELVVNRTIAEDIVSIFKELYVQNYKIEKMELVDVYGGDDSLSMLNNNTSAFNYRMIAGTDKLSNHAFGFAIDINPLYNPCVYTVDGEEVIEPLEGSAYVDRSLDLESMISEDDICYKIFTKYGFSWGGDWEDKKDYQHFEKTDF